MNESVNILDQVFDVFEAVSAWMASSIPSMLSIFWNESTGLTVIGSVTIASLGIGIVLLVLGLLQRFFKFGA